MVESDPSRSGDGGPVSLRVQLKADAYVDARDVAETAKDIDGLLRELERLISPNRQAVANWEWSEPDPSIEFIAFPNGASPETLRRVVSSAQEGFERAAAGQAEWPSDFSPKAQGLARSILRRLKRLEEIVVQATGENALILNDVQIGERVQGKPKPRRIFSSVDGTLRMLAGGEQTVIAGLKEHRTNVNVRCTFEATEEWLERLGRLWRRRVVVEGMVAFDDHRRPRSIIDIKRVNPREGPTDLREFAGAVPDLTGGLSDDDYMTLLRND